LRPDSAIIAIAERSIATEPHAKDKSFLRVFTETGPLIALGRRARAAARIVGPASAQFFNFGGPPRPQPPRSSGGGFGGGGWFGGDLFATISSSRSRSGSSRIFQGAAAGKARDRAERNVLVLGDGMADWLAYGLEDAYAEQPDMGVIRKHKTVSRPDQVSAQGRSGRLAAAAKASSPPRSRTPSSSCSGSTTAWRCASRRSRKSDGNPQTKRATRKTSAPSPAPSLQTRNPE